MLGLTMTMRIQGPLESLLGELASTPSARRRVTLMRRLALSHCPSVIDAIAPFLADESRVRRAAQRALISFGEDARQPMLDVLGDMHRCELHPGALTVLTEIVRDRAGILPVGWPRYDRRDLHLQGVRSPGVE